MSDLVKRLREPYYARKDSLDVTINEAAGRIEVLEKALRTIAMRTSKFEGRGDYVAYVIFSGDIEEIANSALGDSK